MEGESSAVNVFYGIDIGGTTIKTALIAESGNIICKQSLDTRPELGVQAMADRLKDHMHDMLAESGLAGRHVLGVGAGVPAFFDVSRGVVVNAINLGWTEVPLVSVLQETFELPVAVDNDANLAALGESWQGAARGHANALCATVGTGIGGGIVVDGRLHRGAKGMAGEFGHLVVQRESGTRCNCGLYGCLETLASATAIVRAAKVLQVEGKLPADAALNGAEDVFLLAESGNEQARSVTDEAGHWLGYGLALLATAFNPDVIVIGGGVSRAGDVFLDPIRDAFRKNAVPLVWQACELRLATLCNDAGVVGAARLISQQLAERPKIQ